MSSLLCVIATAALVFLCQKVPIKSHAFLLKKQSYSKCHGATFFTGALSDRVCVICPPQPPDGYHDFQKEAHTVASNLSLPLISLDEIVEQRNENEGLLSWEFALSLEPYDFPSSLSGASNKNNELKSTYALSLQFLSTDDRSSNSNKDNKKSKRRKFTRSFASSAKPVCVDFIPSQGSRLGKRLDGEGGGGGDLLLRAVCPQRRKGVSDGERPHGSVIFDFTAGLGQDSLLLAKAGGAHKVVMWERNPIIAALLQDALRRLALVADHALATTATEDSYLKDASSLSKTLSLEIGDARDLRMLSLSGEKDCKTMADVVYLDPMFPVRTKSAAVKKNMQLLQGLLESQQHEQRQPEKVTADDEARRREAEERSLLETACQVARHKVVVKRPIHAPPIGSVSDAGASVFKLRKPSYEIRGSSSRWDIYLP